MGSAHQRGLTHSEEKEVECPVKISAQKGAATEAQLFISRDRTRRSRRDCVDAAASALTGLDAKVNQP